MASLVSGKSDTVASIFRSMSLKEEVVNAKLMNDLLPGDSLKNVLSVSLSELFTTEDIKNSSYDITSIKIEKLVNLLEQEKDSLLTALVIMKFTWNNALSLYNRLINSIKFYEVEYQINPCAFKSAVSCINGGKDALSVMQKLALSVFTENKTVILCLPNDSLVQFYYIIAKLYYTSGFGDKLSVCASASSGNEKPEYLINIFNGDILKNLLSFYNNTSSPCPVIITEDGDISAAADCISKSICQSQLQESSSLSHIFIQESIYKQAVSVLKDKLRLINHGRRLDKKTELELLLNENSDLSDASANLEVFSLCELSSVKLCVGWNPKDIDKGDSFSKARGYITVVPYRNISEVKSLIKDNIKQMCPVAVWSERIDAIKMDLEHQFSSIWINCHGMIHPRALSNTPCNTLYGNIGDICGVGSSEDSNNILHVQSMKGLIKKGYVDWQKRKASVQIKLLELLMKIKPGCESCRSNLKMDCNYWNLYGGIAEKEIASKARYSFASKPVGIILIFCNFSEITSDLKELLRKIVITSLINGNSVIVGANNDLISSCHECFQDLKFLPDGVLTLQKEYDPILFLLSFGRMKPLLGTFLSINKNFIKIIDYCCLAKNYIISSSCLCNEVLTNLTTISQGSWIA